MSLTDDDDSLSHLNNPDEIDETKLQQINYDKQSNSPTAKEEEEESGILGKNDDVTDDAQSEDQSVEPFSETKDVVSVNQLATESVKEESDGLIDAFVDEKGVEKVEKDEIESITKGVIDNDEDVAGVDDENVTERITSNVGGETEVETVAEVNADAVVDGMEMDEGGKGDNLIEMTIEGNEAESVVEAKVDVVENADDEGRHSVVELGSEAIIEVNADAVIGSNDLIDELGTESVVEGEGSEEKVGLTVKDSEVSNADDEGIRESVLEPEVELITEANADVVSDSEREQVDKFDDDVRGVSGDEKDELGENEEASLMSEVKIVDESKSAEEINELFVEEGVKTEMEAGAEVELAKDDSVEKIQLGGDEVETETENQVMEDKVVDEAGKMETDETRSDVDEAGEETDDVPDVERDEEDENVLAQEETGTQDTEMETETDVADSGGKASAGKRKRGKLTISKPAARSSSKKAVGEDVCFICFDGGDLFLCDHRGCTKAYHPSCVNRDEAFFRAKGRWNCGWHLCSICEKTARYMCYTCTSSLCKSCTKDASILLVRGNKGFCEPCMKIINLVENNEQGNKEEQIDFDDKSSWEYLFKDYYIELKSKLSLSYDEIKGAKNPYKGADVLSGSKKHVSSAKRVDADDNGSDSEDSSDKLQTSRPKRRKLKKRSKDVTTGDKAISLPDKSKWASKELLEFISHMRDGDTSMISQFDVQELLLDYIKSKKLRDPRRKSQIVCDARLGSLFGKPRVGHFEMLKLLESHFFATDEHNDDGQGTVVDTESNQLDVDENGDPAKGKKRKTRRKSGSLVRQSNLDDYAAIDMHNISLIYLKRKLMEDLLEDDESFHEKAVGTFVRIRISGSNQKQDLYRLVPVVGTVKAPEPYRVGKKTTGIMVEILNLDKTEVVSIDIISNQEFTEEECKRLRQSIKCGLLSRLTVGEILDKAIEIQVARVNDWLESETLRLSHLRDRASDLGRRKELRECVEKLDVLKTPEERRRRLDEIPKVHADPKMDPSYESDESDSENEDSRRDAFMRSKGFNRRGRGPISPGSESSPKESSSSATKAPNKNWEISRNLSSNNYSTSSPHVSETVNESSWNLGDKVAQESINMEKLNSVISSDLADRVAHTASRSESFSGVTSGTSQSPTEYYVKINESEKNWHYRDPSGKEQGPFSVVQLRKWNNSGYFPDDLKIWRNTDKESHSVFLADALAGKIPKELPSDDGILPATPHSGKVSERAHIDQSPRPAKLSKWDVPDTTSLHSPTPKNNGVVPAPTVAVPNVMTHPTATSSVLNSVGQPGVPYSPTPNSQQLNMAGPSHQSTEPHSVQVHAHTPPSVIQTGQAAINQNLQTESWAQSQGHAMVAPNVPNPSGPATWPQWSAQGTQTNIQPPTTPNASWGMRPPENNTSIPANSNAGWAPPPTVPNGGWPNWNSPMQVPNSGNTTQGWVAPPVVGPPPVTGNMNPGWGPQGQVWGPAPAQGQAWAPPNGNPAAPVQGPISGNGWGPPSGNPGAPLPVQGHAPPNGNQGWGPPPANQGHWIGEHNHNSGQFQGHPGGHGRDSGFNNGRPWNRHGGSPGGSLNRRDTPCPFLARRGQCRKGAYCDYRH